MDLPTISRFINRIGGGEDGELYCTRVYVQARINPYGWKETEVILNLIFYLVRGDRNHVKASYLWERKERNKMLQHPDWLRVKFRGENTCQHCGQRFFPGSGTITNKNVGETSVTLNFCGESCASEYYLENLRRVGM